MQLQNKVALITGGASGLGEACVRRFIGLGMKVVILDRDEARGKALADELGQRVRFAQADVSNESDVQAAIDTAYSAFGELSVVVNCAGVAWASRTVGKEGP